MEPPHIQRDCPALEQAVEFLGICRSGQPAQSDGHQLWHADGTRLVRPYAVGERVYAPRTVKRNTVADVFDLQTGRATAHLFQHGVGVTPLSGVVESIGA